LPDILPKFFKNEVRSRQTGKDKTKSRWDVVYHPAHVRKILHQLGFSVQFPREKLALADKKAQETWLRETYPEIKKRQTDGRQDTLRG